MMSNKIRFVDEALATKANSGDNSKNRIAIPSAEDKLLIGASLDRISRAFPSVQDSLYFSTCSGRALGLARVRDEGKLFVIAVNTKDLLSLEKMGDNFSPEKRMDYMLSHELGHVLDRNAAALARSDLAYCSSKMAGFHPEGEFYKEAANARQNHKLIDWAYRYPMSLPADDLVSGIGSNTKAKEVFAQTIALYVNDPAIMQEHLPKTYAYAKQFIEQMAVSPCLVGGRAGIRSTSIGSDVSRGEATGEPRIQRDGSSRLSGAVRGFSSEMVDELSGAKQSANAAALAQRIGGVAPEFLATKQNVHKVNQFCESVAKGLQQKLGVAVESKLVTLQELSEVFGDNAGKTDLRLQFSAKQQGNVAALAFGKDMAVQLVTATKEMSEKIAATSVNKLAQGTSIGKQENTNRSVTASAGRGISY